jgi:polygalacturonase
MSVNWLRQVVVASLAMLMLLLHPPLCRADARDDPLASSQPSIATPAGPDIPDRTFSVTDFGAVPDGKTMATGAISSAISAASKAGGGIVRFPPGQYLSGAVQLQSKIELRLDQGATLRFSQNPSDYPIVLTRFEGTECMNYCGLLSARDCTDIAITGQGTIDGQGSAWWDWAPRSKDSLKHLRELGETTDDPRARIFGTPQAALRPCLFEPVNCKRILIDQVAFTNSPFWTIHPLYCSDLTARNLSIHGTGPNTDGLDLDSCSNVLIEKCHFDTGDDCITLKSGRDRDGRRVGKPTENVIVRNCTFARGHGTVVIGSEMSGGVRNVLAENLTADGTDAGVRIKTRIGRGGTIGNITYRNLDLKSIRKQAITIDMFYDVGNNPDVDQSGREGIPTVRNIKIENLKCDGTRQAIILRGLPESPIEGVMLRDVHITDAKNGAEISNVKEVRMLNCSIAGQ